MENQLIGEARRETICSDARLETRSDDQKTSTMALIKPSSSGELSEGKHCGQCVSSAQGAPFCRTKRNARLEKVLPLVEYSTDADREGLENSEVSHQGPLHVTMALLDLFTLRSAEGNNKTRLRRVCSLTHSNSTEDHHVAIWVHSFEKSDKTSLRWLPSKRRGTGFEKGIATTRCTKASPRSARTPSSVFDQEERRLGVVRSPPTSSRCLEQPLHRLHRTCSELDQVRGRP